MNVKHNTICHCCDIFCLNPVKPFTCKKAREDLQQKGPGVSLPSFLFSSKENYPHNPRKLELSRTVYLAPRIHHSVYESVWLLRSLISRKKGYHSYADTFPKIARSEKPKCQSQRTHCKLVLSCIWVPPGLSHKIGDTGVPLIGDENGLAHAETSPSR